MGKLFGSVILWKTIRSRQEQSRCGIKEMRTFDLERFCSLIRFFDETSSTPKHSGFRWSFMKNIHQKSDAELLKIREKLQFHRLEMKKFRQIFEKSKRATKTHLLYFTEIKSSLTTFATKFKYKAKRDLLKHATS